MTTENNAPRRHQGSHAGATGEIKKPVDALTVFKGQIANQEPELRKVLPPQIQTERFTRIMLTAVQQTPDLLTVDRKSLWSAAMKCATDGLLPDGREAAFVIFGKTAAYLPMIGGILKKVRQSGELASIQSGIVHRNDKFTYKVDIDGEHMSHEPNFLEERGDRMLAYAIAKTKDSAVYIEIMTEKQLMAVRDVSRAKDKGPWAGPFADEMRRKTVIRRLAKRLPMSTDLEAVIQRDDELYEFNKKDGKAAVAEDLHERLNAVNETPVVEDKIPDFDEGHIVAPERLPEEQFVENTNKAVKEGMTEAARQAAISNQGLQEKPEPTSGFIFEHGRYAGQSITDVSREELKTYYFQLKSKGMNGGLPNDLEEVRRSIGEWLGVA